MEKRDIPKHIAIIADGNRRWARERGLPTLEGHRKGAENVKLLSRKAKSMGVTVLTFWVFSTENWQRTVEETGYLMKLFEVMIEGQVEEAIKEETRIVHLGRKDRIPESLRKKIEFAEEKTKHFTEYYLAFALDYGGRDEILRAIGRMSKVEGLEKDMKEEDINRFLDTRDLPNPEPDLVIRTSGEQRMSGFMAWQAAYSEYLFSDAYFPDFDSNELEKAVQEYETRKRRFGK